MSRVEREAGADRWREFGRCVLEAHHRHRATFQCTCGHLLENCAVITAAERLGLPIDDPALAQSQGSRQPPAPGPTSGRRPMLPIDAQDLEGTQP